MSSDEYWIGVRKKWREAVGKIDAADAESTQSNAESTQMKLMWRLSLRRATDPIYITGTRGCGKTTLYDALLNRISGSYKPPGMSIKMQIERTVLRGPSGERVRSWVRVIPGQSDLTHGLNKSLFEPPTIRPG